MRRWLPLFLLFLPWPLFARAQNAAPIPDTPFYQDVHEAYPLTTPAENDVRALSLDREGRLWAATGDGVRCLDNGRWNTPAGGKEIGPAYALYTDTQGMVWIGAWNGLYYATKEAVVPADIKGTPIGAIRALRSYGSAPETLFAAGPAGIWRREGERWKPLPGRWNTAIRAILPTADNHLWIGSASGLYRLELSGPQPTSVRYSRPNVLLSSNINALTSLPDGTVCIGSTGGLDFYRGAQRVRSLSTKAGMPNRNARAIAWDPDGRLWVATALGVARWDRGKWSLRHSRRWLQSDDTRDVVIGADNTAWVATAAGVDAIRRKKMTLADKATTFLQILRARHIRPPGLVGPAVLLTPGDLSRSFIEDDDNDGEHTGMYCAMESFRYAVTKAPDARENAKAAFHALLVLQRATGTPHFIARSVLPLGTPPRHEMDHIFTPQEIAESHRTDPRAKIIEKRWVPGPDGKWLWKRDASSDEVDGHLFGYTTYYDLAADDAEKKLVAEEVDRLIGGILDHGYNLVDIDGQPTQWGHWSPESLNADPNWYEERPGNSIEILSYLGVACAMTGKERYRQAARDLIARHGYDKNMLLTNFDTPSERTHIEDELLSIVYPDLMTHLIFPSLKAITETSMRRWHRTAETD
ncbi:MAG TPA: two-component regulator propeller domain-containing protein, partial [Chthonomonadaceae bacterium]|nr:two-component regulator propeller domain-containing protein [Chthonomonadaceae bacterium]